MPRFVARPVVVEAHQYAGHTTLLPEAFRMAVRRHMVGGAAQVMCGDELRPCKHGDWIMRGPTGAFQVLTDAEFETWFDDHQPALPAATRRPAATTPRKEPVHG